MSFFDGYKWYMEFQLKSCIIIVGLLFGGMLILMILMRTLWPNPEPSSVFFFKEIAEGRLEEAYEGTGYEYQLDQTFEEFNIFVKKNNLEDYQSAIWPRLSVNGSVATEEGFVVLKNGTRIPLTVHYKQENGYWVITGVTSTATFGTSTIK